MNHESFQGGAGGRTSLPMSPSRRPINFRRKTSANVSHFIFTPPTFRVFGSLPSPFGEVEPASLHRVHSPALSRPDNRRPQICSDELATSSVQTGEDSKAPASVINIYKRERNSCSQAQTSYLRPSASPEVKTLREEKGMEDLWPKKCVMS